MTAGTGRERKSRGKLHSSAAPANPEIANCSGNWHLVRPAKNPWTDRNHISNLGCGAGIIGTRGDLGVLRDEFALVVIGRNFAQHTPV